jgi:hypothetical protein
VLGILKSFLGIGESFLVKREKGTRGPPPPDPVLLIASPPADSDVLSGTGDGTDEPFETPTFLI